MRWALLVLASLLVLAAPAQAGYRLIYPPGHAGADEYAEVIPTADGNTAPPSPGGGSGPLTKSSTQAIAHIGNGRAGAAKLERLGKDGHAAAALATATAPASLAPAAPAKARPGRHGVTAPAVHVPAAGGSISSGISHALGGSGGLGVLLPILLLATVLAALVFGLARLRRRPTEPAQS
jgi:hypothetical protein